MLKKKELEHCLINILAKQFSSSPMEVVDSGRNLFLLNRQNCSFGLGGVRDERGDEEEFRQTAN